MASWSPSGVPPDRHLFGALRHHSVHRRAGLDIASASCASASFCGACGEHFIDSSGYFAGAVWNGTRWGPQRQLEESGFAVGPVSVVGGEQLPLISCATSTFCKAAAGDHVWTWNGSSWGTPMQVLGLVGRAAGRFADLSRPTTTFCYGVLSGSPATAIRWQHGAWEPSRAILPSGSFLGITGSSAAYCLGSGDFGSGLTYLAYTGLAWSPAQPGSIRIGDTRPQLECLSPTSCVRSGMRYEIYNGVARPLAMPAPPDPVACWSPYRCLVVGGDRSSTTVAGSR